MSGGNHNFIYLHIQEELCGKMHDPELDDLMKDIAELAHQLEWAESGDTDWSTYQKYVTEFKNKWFKQNRTKRLKQYIDDTCERTKNQLYDMIGCDTDESY